MDQLDINLSELRNAVVDQRRRSTAVLTANKPATADESILDAVVTSEAQPESFAADHTRTRSWFKRLFGG